MRFVPKLLFALAVAAPWLWLFTFVAFVVDTTLIVGHLPRYSNPDPKHVREVVDFGYATVMLGAPALISPLLLALAQGLRQLMRLPLLPWRWILFNLAGIALIAFLFFGDPLGLGSWYLD